MNPISFAAGIVPGAGPVETIHAAAAGGFDMTGLWVEPEQWTPALLRETKAALAETGLPLLDVEVIWIKPGDDLAAVQHGGPPLLEIAPSRKKKEA